MLYMTSYLRTPVDGVTSVYQGTLQCFGTTFVYVTQREKTSQIVQKINLDFFSFSGTWKCIFSNGICGKNFSGPYLIIWRVWKWGKNWIFVEVVQRTENKIVRVLLSYLRVWPRFKVIYFILRLKGGICVKILTISNFLVRRKAEMLLKVVKKYQILFVMFYNHIWELD